MSLPQVSFLRQALFPYYIIHNTLQFSVYRKSPP